MLGHTHTRRNKAIPMLKGWQAIISKGGNLVESANTKELLLISLDPLPACHGAAPAPAYRVSNRGIVPLTHRGLANRGRSVCLLADSTSLPADPKSIACSSRKSLGLFKPDLSPYTSCRGLPWCCR